MTDLFPEIKERWGLTREIPKVSCCRRPTGADDVAWLAGEVERLRQLEAKVPDVKAGLAMAAQILRDLAQGLPTTVGDLTEKAQGLEELGLELQGFGTGSVMDTKATDEP